MGLSGKEQGFNLDTFYHQLKSNCTEFGIHQDVIDRYIGKVEDMKLNKIWGLKQKEQEDAQDF